MQISSAASPFQDCTVLNRQLGRRCSRDVELAVAVKVTVRLEVAQTRNAPIVNVNIVDGNVLAAARATQDVVVPTLIRGSTSDVSDYNVRDKDTCGRVACWSAVQVVLLDINTIDGDVLNTDVLE